MTLLAAVAAIAVAGAAGARPDAMAVPRTSQAATLTDLVFNTPLKSPLYGDLYAAVDEGFFSKEGLSLTFASSSLPPATVLLSGAAQVVAGQPTQTYIPDAQGADLVAVYSPGKNFEVLAAKDPAIKTVADLVGKKVGVFSLQDTDVVYLNHILAQNKVPTNSVTMIAAGPTLAKLAAVEAGAVDAAFLFVPGNFLGAQVGVHSIFPTSKLKSGQIPAFYEVRQSWASQHPHVVVAFIRALDKAHKWLFDKKNKAAAIAILAKWMGVATDIATKSYDLYYTRPGFVYSEHGEWDAKVVKQTAKDLQSIGLITGPPVPYAKTVNTLYLNTAWRQLKK